MRGATNAGAGGMEIVASQNEPLFLNTTNFEKPVKLIVVNLYTNNEYKNSFALWPGVTEDNYTLSADGKTLTCNLPCMNCTYTFAAYG